MVGEYKVITLCGSTRFKDAFMEAQKRLTLEGNIVISVGLFGHSGDDEVWTEGTKEMLDDMHKRKIDMADEISLRFKSIMDMIANIFDGNLSKSRFTMVPLLYSLFVVLYHMNYGIPNFNSRQITISENHYSKIRSALEEIEEVFNAETLSAEQQAFITACKKSTTHKINKQRRCDYIAAVIYKYLGD